MNKAGTQRIDTHRLILRRFRIEDAEDMFRHWASDAEVTKFLTWPAHVNADTTRKVLNDWIPRYKSGSYFNWAIEWKENKSVIGNISVVKLNEETEAADIGYCLSRSFWGHGIMPEALRAVLEYLFETVGISRAAACHDTRNLKSGRVMEKAGMEREGILKRSGKNNLGICDEVWYALLRENYVSVKHTPSDFPDEIRLAKEDELDEINVLRKQVNDLHVRGKPEVFKPGFCTELSEYIHDIWNDPQKRICVAVTSDKICGFAVLNHIIRPETPFMFKREYLDIDEFGVDADFRRKGIASAMIRFIRDYAKEQGFCKLELNMWEFNHEALAFYESAGFSTYRRYMEIRL